MKKKILNKLIAAALVCGSILAVGNIPANAADKIKEGMKIENGNIYFYDDETGVKEANVWVFYHTKDSEGWYHSDENGMMQKNVTIKDAKGNDCVLGADGKLTNRIDPEFNDSEVDESEIDQLGVQKSKYDSYNWKQVDGNWYFMSEKGEKKTGWVLDETTKKWYYCNEDGVMQKNTAITTNGNKFVLGADGAMIN